MNTNPSTNPTVAEIAGYIAASYMATNKVASDEINDVISSITNSVRINMFGEEASDATKESLPHHASIDMSKDLVKQTVFDDYIVHIPTGRKLKMMKRVLGLDGMTPDEYRSKYGLPADYPMTCKNYSKKRSKFAKSIGLGKKDDTAEVKIEGNWNNSGHGIAEGLEAIKTPEDTVEKDTLICLLDGKRVKILSRYLKRHHNMTPDQYRAMFNLGDDYPMVSPKLSEVRRATAKRIGLGKKDSKSNDGVSETSKTKETVAA